MFHQPSKQYFDPAPWLVKTTKYSVLESSPGSNVIDVYVQITVA